MKHSRVQWLGDVPQHWAVLPHRAILEEVKEHDHPQEQMLSVTITSGVIRQQALLADTSKKDSSNQDKSAYKLVRPGDIAYNKMRAWQGAVGVSKYRGIVSPAYVVQRARRGVDPQYLHYLLRTPAFAKEAERWSYGITSDMWSLRPEHFKLIYSCVPPLPEQLAIVRFLGFAESRVRRYIHAKQKLIERLEEQKLAIVDRAISGRFIRHLPLNILGLPQQVPEATGWKSVSVGHLIQKRWLAIQDGNHGELHPKASEFVENGIPFLMAKDIRPSGVNLDTCAKIDEARARRLRIGFAQPGDVLLTHKATIGQVSIVPDRLNFPFVMLTPQVTYYRTLNSDVNNLYLMWYFQAPIFQEQLHVLGLNQSTRSYIGLLEQRNLIVCFPSRERQLEIVGECETASRQVIVALEKTIREIDLIGEYRRRLITDVVTGKLDTREAAAHLPDHGETPAEGPEEGFGSADEGIDESALIGAEVEA